MYVASMNIKFTFTNTVNKQITDANTTRDKLNTVKYNCT